MITVSSVLYVCNKCNFSGKPSKLYNVNYPDWALILKMGQNRARIQEEIASKSQIVSVLSVEETIMEKEPACNLNSSRSEFEIFERIREDSEEFPDESGSIGC